MFAPSSRMPVNPDVFCAGPPARALLCVCVSLCLRVCVNVCVRVFVKTGSGGRETNTRRRKVCILVCVCVCLCQSVVKPYVHAHLQACNIQHLLHGSPCLIRILAGSASRMEPSCLTHCCGRADAHRRSAKPRCEESWMPQVLLPVDSRRQREYDAYLAAWSCRCPA